MNDLTIIRRSLTSRFFSTITTILTVAIAVALLIVLLSMKDSGFQAFKRGTGNMHMVVSRDSSPLVSVLNGVFYANPPQRFIEWEKYKQITGPNFSGNGRPLPLDYAVPVAMGDSFKGFPVVATTTDFFAKYKPVADIGAEWAFKKGRPFEANFEAVIGADVAEAHNLIIGDILYLAHGAGSGVTGGEIERLKDQGGHDHSSHAQGDPDDQDQGDDGQGDDEQGDDDQGADDHAHDHDHDHSEPHVHREFGNRVIGILDRTGGPHDRAIFTDLESSWVLHAFDRRIRDGFKTTTVADLTAEDRKITGIYMRAASRQGRMMSGGQQMIFNQLRADPSLTVAEPGNQIETLFKIVSNIDQIFLAMAGVVLFSSGIAIMLALYNSMEQRRRQIATLRVLGSSRPKIFGLVLTESAIIGFLGALLGLGLAFAGMYAVTLVMRRELGLVIEPKIEPFVMMAVVLGTVVMASIAGLIPALVAYRTPVARHLKPLG